MATSKVKDRVPEFLASLSNESCDDKIAAFRLIPKFITWYQRRGQTPPLRCNHTWTIIAQFSRTEPYWWDNRPVQRQVIIQRCTCGQIKKNVI
jgi:hypothetical protein